MHVTPPTPPNPAAVQHRRARSKAPDACPCCGRDAHRLHKVRVHYGRPWVAACALCAAVLIERSDATVYGGLISPRSVRRRRAG